MSLPTFFLYSCVVICAGVLIASFVSVSSGIFSFLALSAAMFCAVALLKGRGRLAAFGALFLFMLFGFLRFDYAWRLANGNELVGQAQKSETVSFDAVVAADPQTSDSQQKLVVRSPQWDGKILVVKYRYPEYAYGDELRISGVLTLPEQIDTFDYKNYLAKDGIYALVERPDIEIIAINRGNAAMSGIFWVKRRLSGSLYENLPYPHNALMVAILFGDQSRIPACSIKEAELAESEGKTCAKMKEQFNITGLRHLTAVSGMHVVIMASVIMALCLAAGLWRTQAFWLTMLFVWLFILMIGMPASAVRAGIMGTLMLAAQRIGRPASSSRIVVIAAAAMVAQNPLLLRFDIGFQLSFLAVMGMIHFGPFFRAKLKFVQKSGIFDVHGVLSQTLAAQVMTLPILIFNFGTISLYGPVANILAVPLVTLMTIGGFLLAGLGLFVPPLAWLVSLPVWLALEYLIRLTEIFSGLPAAAAAASLPWFCLVLAYLALATAAVKLGRRRKLVFDNDL